jgi:hypothetical protein
VSDGVLTADESKQLSEHDVDQKFVDATRTAHYMKETTVIRKRVEKARRLSPQDEAELVAIGERLKITNAFQRLHFFFGSRGSWPIELAIVRSKGLLAGPSLLYVILALIRNAFIRKAPKKVS